MSKIFLVVSGGPGLYDPRDTNHDKNWGNYVESFLLNARYAKPPVVGGSPALADLAASKGPSFPPYWIKDEDILWLVYKPAYTARWNDDKTKRDPDFRAKHVMDVQKKGFGSYTDNLEKKASGYGWKLNWITKSADFWNIISGLTEKISRVWYFGHASEGDLWLVLAHDSEHNPIAKDPYDETAVKWTDINPVLITRFQPGGTNPDPNTIHMFRGCNTAKFAKEWSTKYKVWSQGYEGTLLFTRLYDGSPWMPDPGDSCVLKGYKPDGTEYSP